MLQTDLWRQQLALEKRSVSEIATALSIVAVAGATLYNIGYFAPVERSLVSLLTVQDLLFGTAIALLPMVGAVVLSFTISRWIKAAPERPRLAIVLGLASLLAGTFGFKYFFYSTPPSTLGHLGSAMLHLPDLQP